MTEEERVRPEVQAQADAIVADAQAEVDTALAKLEDTQNQLDAAIVRQGELLQELQDKLTT